MIPTKAIIIAALGLIIIVCIIILFVNYVSYMSALMESRDMSLMDLVINILYLAGILVMSRITEFIDSKSKD